MWSLERWRAGLNRAEFDCGEELLNLWLRGHAGQSERRDTARTFVALGDGDVIVGYFSLVAGQLAADESGIAPLDSRYPIPCVRLARLAVDLAGSCRRCPQSRRRRLLRQMGLPALPGRPSAAVSDVPGHQGLDSRCRGVI